MIDIYVAACDDQGFVCHLLLDLSLSSQVRLASYNQPSACASVSCNSGLWHDRSQRSCRRKAITLRHELVSSSNDLTRMRLCEVRAARSKPQK